jgi:hypothetical protein
VRGRWLKAITPTRTERGTSSTNRRAAARAASSRLGATSVEVIEPETSVTSRIDARSSGTARVACGFAAATISPASAIASSAIGTWRRQRGATGATLTSSAGLANAAALRPRRRASRT